MRALKDRYGFLFWLQWIVSFAGIFIVAAIFWTTIMMWLFGRIRGTELSMTWTVAVFGSWFILVIPFMRKKEQIWKRLNPDQERAVDAWFGGMSVFLLLLVISALFWSAWFLRIPDPDGGTDPRWIKAVFGTWLFITLPFLVIMYRQADKIFKDAVQRQTYVPRFKSMAMDRSKRFLSPPLVAQLKTIPANLPKGHVVSVILKDGRQLDHVFIVNGNEILGIYDQETLGFEACDIQALKGLKNTDLPEYQESLWLRLDGVS